MRKLTEDEEALLIELIPLHDTPTELIRKAFKAVKCELRLTFANRAVVVRDINDAEEE